MNKWDDTNLEYLKLLHQKSAEQADLYYKRLAIYVTLIAFALGGSVTVLASAYEKFDPKMLWLLASLPTIFGLILSIIWYKILKISENWILFWRAKTIVFEKYNAPADPTHWFMLDREYETDNYITAIKEYSKNKEDLIINKKFESDYDVLQRLKDYKNKIPSPKKGGGGITSKFEKLVIILGSAMLLFTIICLLFAYFHS